MSEEKLTFDNVPPRAYESLAKAMNFGYDKYNGRTWPEVETKKFVNAIQRHLICILKGEWVDIESRLPHVWHIMANAAILDEKYRLTPLETCDYIVDRMNLTYSSKKPQNTNKGDVSK